MPSVLKEQKRFETRKLTEDHYNWDHIAEKWEKYFDNVQLVGLQGKWAENLPVLNSIDLQSLTSNNRNPYDIITKMVSTHMPHHQFASSILLLNMIRDLDYGFAINGIQTEPYGLDKATAVLNNMINNNNLAQNAKHHLPELKNEDFIQYAHMKENIKE